MSRTKEHLIEACNCECDCPADVLEVEVNDPNAQTMAALAAANSKANDALKAAADRATDTLNAASDRLDEVRKSMSDRMNGNGHAGLVDRLAPAAAVLPAIASMVQERRDAASEKMDDLRGRTADRMADVRGTAADKLDDVRSRAADRIDDVRSKAADSLGGVRDTAGKLGDVRLPWQRKRRQTLFERLNPADTFSSISGRAQDGLSKIGDALPKKRKPSLWQRLALTSAFAGLLDSAKDTFGDARKQAKRQAKMLARAKKAEMRSGLNMSKMATKSASRSARKAEKQAKKLLAKQSQRRGGVSPLTWGLALGLGAGLMYFFDPEAGGRRRGLLRDQFIHLQHMAQDRFSGATEDIGNRAAGLTAEAHRYTAEEQPSDRVLAERVRAQLGFLVSHPGSVDVMARGGIVTLRGPVLATEVEPLLTRVRLIPGVTNVENYLEVHQQAGNVPGLQGGSPAQTGM